MLKGWMRSLMDIGKVPGCKWRLNTAMEVYCVSEDVLLYVEKRKLAKLKIKSFKHLSF